MNFPASAGSGSPVGVADDGPHEHLRIVGGQEAIETPEKEREE